MLGPALLLGAVEGALRWADVGYPTSFLVPREVAGRPVLTDNPFFGCRFFPPRLTRLSAPIVLERKKAPGALRVVVLGESAAMGEPQPEFGLARMLEVLLAERYPGRPVEVVNAAMTAINSHVIAEIARDLSAFQPDVMVLYLGNNEVVGPYGPGTVLAPSAPLTRARVLASRLRLAQLLRTATPGPGWSGMEMFAGHEVAAEDPRLAPVYAHFRANVQRIIQTAQRAGAVVVVSTVAVNLRDCAPFAGAAARSAYADGRWAEARDLDTLRFRADSTLNNILREAAVEPVRLVDAEALFGAAGRADFVDHVHFSAAGTYRLACAVADTVAPGGPPWPSLDACLDRLLHSRWAEWDLVDGLIGRRQRPPFAGQPGNDEQLADLQTRRAALVETLVRDDALLQHYQAAVAAHPKDGWRYAQWAELLMNAGAYVEAEQVMRRGLALMSHRFDTRSGLALLLGYQGRADEGVRVLRDAPGKHGHFVAEFLLSNARTLARERRFSEALVFAEAAVAEAPENIDAQVELAARYAAVGRKKEAERAFREVLQREANHPVARDELTALLAFQGRWDEAAAVLLAGGTGAETRLKYAQLLQAKRELEAAGAESAPVP